MKYDITPEDQKQIEQDMNSNRTLKHLKDMSYFKFSIGDVLVRQDRYGEGEWKTYQINGTAPKYVYAFENELGVGYIRRLSVNGRRFVERSMCVIEFDPSTTRFVTDPDYTDHLMLAEEGEVFDPKVRYEELKKKREAINRKNEKLRIRFANEAEAIAWAKSLKAGDQFWFGYSRNDILRDAKVVSKIHVAAPNMWSNRDYESRIECIPMNGAASNFVYFYSLTSYYIYNSKPYFVEDQV